MIITQTDNLGHNGLEDNYVSNDYTIFDDFAQENDSASPDRESNTRSDLIRRFDWLTWVGNGLEFDVIERLLSKYFGDDYDAKDYGKSVYRGANPFTNEFRSANGAALFVRETKKEVAYDDIDKILEEAKYDIILSLSGRPLAVHYEDNDLINPIKDFIELTEIGLHCSRIDLKFIDYQKMLDLEMMEQAGINGNYRGVKRHKSDKPIKLGKEDPNSKRLSPILAGNTQNFGSRGSSHFYRFYMEKYIHDRDSYAYELELKGKKAQGAIDRFIRVYNGNDKYYAKADDRQLFNDIFIGAIDFIDRSQQCPHTGSLKKCDRLLFWQELCNYIQAKVKVNLSVSKPKPTLTTSWEWLKRQCKGFINILRKGAEKFGFDHHLLIDWLTLKDDESMPNKPNIIQNDIALKVSEIAKDGLSAIMTMEEIKEFTEFAIASMYG